MSKHAEGKIGYEFSNANNAFEIAPIGRDGLLDWDRELCITADDNEANARRLVACWNACDGLPTDLLEQMVNPTYTYTALLKERNDLVKERDELVGILRRTVKYANRKPFNLTKEIDAVLTKYPEAS